MITKEIIFEYSAGSRGGFADILRFFDDAADEDCCRYGLGKDIVRERGALWIKAREYVNIIRMPENDERILITTYACSSAHFLFPRVYELKDLSGNTLVFGDCMWILMDPVTRTMADPRRSNVNLEGPKRKCLCMKRFTAVTEDCSGGGNNTDSACSYNTESGSFDIDVGPELIDYNGHMNNKHYVRLCQDMMSRITDKDSVEKKPGAVCCADGISGSTELLVEFQNEALEGEIINVAWQMTEKGCLFTGTVRKPSDDGDQPAKDKPCFRLELTKN